MTLTEAREAIAAALSAVEDIHVRDRGPLKAPRQGDGWVTIQSLAPADYTRCTARLTAIVVLGSDEALAETLLETWAVACIDAVTTGDIPTSDVVLEPILLTVDTGGALWAFTLTMTTEVEP